MTETTPLTILHRYNDYTALISLGHSYTLPSKITKRHLQELLAGYGDDELLHLAQIETPTGQPRPVIVRPAEIKRDRPEWLCLCENEVQV